MNSIPGTSVNVAFLWCVSDTTRQYTFTPPLLAYVLLAVRGAIQCHGQFQVERMGGNTQYHELGCPVTLQLLAKRLLRFSRLDC
jgi:hypothetical protein